MVEHEFLGNDSNQTGQQRWSKGCRRRGPRDAIAALRRASDLTPDNHKDKPRFLASLSSALKARFDRLKATSDGQDAITALRRADELAPDDERHCASDKADHLLNLGSARYELFANTKHLKDLDDALESLCLCNALTPADNENKRIRLFLLSQIFSIRFDHHNDTKDRDEAISMQRQAVNLSLDDHADKGQWLTELGGMIFRRFEANSDLDDLNDSIAMLEWGNNLLNDGHMTKPAYLTLLLVAFQRRYELLSDPKDLDALTCRNPAHKIRAYRAMEDLQEAITLSSRASELPCDRIASRVAQLTCLGLSLRLRFVHLGDPNDLELAIMILRQVCELEPTSQIIQTNIGGLLHERYERFGSVKDLEDAIAVLRRANELVSDDPVDKTTCMNNLGLSLWARFRILKEATKDLDEAADLLRQAEARIPRNSPENPYVSTTLRASTKAASAPAETSGILKKP
ncbi:TPR protein [Salix suchowensis]|nr:TPR protein [Salix suchowensis]